MTRKHNNNSSNDVTSQQIARDAFDSDVPRQQFEAEVEKASDAEVSAAIATDIAENPTLPPISVADFREVAKEEAELEQGL